MKVLLRGFIILFLLAAVAPSVFAYGEGPTFAGSTTGFPVCDKTAPKAVWPFWAKVVANGKVELTWGKMEDVSSWTVAYGVAPGTYIYGLSSFGNADWRSLTINDLPGGTYYFVIRGNNGCKPGPFSSEWKVVVGEGGSGFASSVFNPVNAAVPPVYTNPATGKQVIPTVNPVKPGAVMPTPAPQKISWWQKIFNFIFGKK